MNTHTPGPWRFDPDEIGISYDTAYGLLDSDDRPLHVHVSRNVAVGLTGFGINERAEANARLIAAAPDLLAACEALAGVRAGRCTSCNAQVDAEGYCGCEPNGSVEYQHRVDGRLAIIKARGGA